MSPLNRLSGERSPYLRQHALNPVDWYPWGEEAFDRARREDKPVFLSIGYSACHWCHVMERESFGDEEVARVLNADFVCVKVDREERPDLDRHYMAVCQSITGSGGWPLTIVMTPDKRPFFAGTYFPKSRRWGRPGLLELAPMIAESWRTKRQEIIRSAEEITAAAGGARAPGRGRSGERLSKETLDEAFRELAADFDGVRGGFGGAPEVPGRPQPRISPELLAKDLCRRGLGHGREGPSRRCGAAASTITSASAFTAIRPTRIGSSPTSRRCSMIRPSWRKSTRRDSRPRGAGSSGGRRRRSRTMSSGTWPRPKADSPRRKTRTAKARKASSISGRGTSSILSWVKRTASSPLTLSASPTKAMWLKARNRPGAGASFMAAGFPKDLSPRRGRRTRPRPKPGSSRSGGSSSGPATKGPGRSRTRRSSRIGTGS